ncbi:MAG: HIT family protein, partial [Bacteroidales bacterium]|nr:HIT family protein [Bacteroidales bacterium]
MASIFTKIINGEIPSYKIAEDEKCYAFLDISPLAEGHTLVVPKQEVDYIFDLEDELLMHLHLFAKKVAKAMKEVIECEKIGMAVIGLDVRHTHIHLV